MATKPLPPWGSPPLQSGGQNQNWPTSGQGGYITPPPPPGGSPPLQSGGQNQKWLGSGQGGYITPAAWGIACASKRGAESEVAHKWARWLHNPCRLGVPNPSRRGAESEVGHKWARWLHNPCRLGGPRQLQSRGQNQKWPTSGQCGYITRAAWGVPIASKRGAESKVAQKWARWLHNATAWGVPTASERGAKSEVAHKWARWLHNPCRLGGPHRIRAGGTITSFPQVGKVAT